MPPTTRATLDAVAEAAKAVTLWASRPPTTVPVTPDIEWYKFYATLALGFVAAALTVLQVAISFRQAFIAKVVAQTGMAQAEIAKAQADTAKAQMQIARLAAKQSRQKMIADLFDRRMSLISAIREFRLLIQIPALITVARLKKFTFDFDKAEYLFGDDLSKRLESISTNATMLILEVGLFDGETGIPKEKRMEDIIQRATQLKVTIDESMPMLKPLLDLSVINHDTFTTELEL